MFLGNLSTVQERKGSKSRGAAKKSKEDDAELDDLIAGFKINDLTNNEATKSNTGITESRIILNKEGDLPILYNDTTKKTDRDGSEITAEHSSSNDVYGIPRKVMMSFLTDVVTILLDDKNTERIVEMSWTKKTPLHIEAMEHQRDIMEFNHQIERNFGCRVLSMLPRTCPGDIAIQEAASAFMLASMRCYISALRKRSKRFGPKKRSTGGFERENIMEFFEGCNALMALQETKDTLRKEFLTVKKGKSPPNEKVIELQRGVLALLGLDPDYACSRLNRIGEMYPNDQELNFKMQQFALCAQTACREAMMDEEERKAFYEDIPMYMRHNPHMFVMQQNMMLQQQQQQQQQQLGVSTEPGTGGPRTSSGISSAPMKNMDTFNGQRVPQGEGVKIMSEIMSDESTKERMTALASRVTGSRAAMELEVSKMDLKERGIFLDAFSYHPVLDNVNSAGSDPSERVKRLLELSNSDLDMMVKMQVIVSESVRDGVSVKSMMPPLSAAGDAESTRRNAMENFIRSEGKGMGMMDDVSSGKAAGMDR